MVVGRRRSAIDSIQSQGGDWRSDGGSPERESKSFGELLQARSDRLPLRAPPWNIKQSYLRDGRIAYYSRLLLLDWRWLNFPTNPMTPLSTSRFFNWSIRCDPFGLHSLQDFRPWCFSDVGLVMFVSGICVDQNSLVFTLVLGFRLWF